MASGSYIKGKSKEDNLAELPRTAQSARRSMISSAWRSSFDALRISR
jgi:hypothetical protein